MTTYRRGVENVMPKRKRKKEKPERPSGAPGRNPFAGRPQSGAGFHSEAKYGKKERRQGRQETEGEEDPEAAGR